MDEPPRYVNHHNTRRLRTLRVRERLRRYLAGFVREETALRDGSQNSKTPVADAGKTQVPAAEGNTRVPRTVVPATTPEDVTRS